MSNSVECLNRSYNATAGSVTHASLHTADPGRTGANEVTGGAYAREPVTYGTPTDGAGDIVAPVTINVPEGVTVTHYGMWDGDEFLFGRALAQTQEFATAGVYVLNTAPHSSQDVPS